MATDKTNVKSVLKDSFDTLKLVFTKPSTKALDKTKDFQDAKKSGIFSGIAVVAYLLLSLISAVITTVVTKSWTGKTNVDFNNLNNLDFFKTLGDSLLYIAGAIAIVAAVVYVMGLIFKKQPNFMKVLGIAAAGFAPYYAASFVGTILGYFWAPLSLFVTVAGFSLTTGFIVNGVNKEVALEGDKKIFFHVASVTVIAIIAYFIATNIIKTSILGGFNF